MSGEYEDLVAEATAVSVEGWDFTWLDGRATEERPPRGYARLMVERLAQARSSLDIQTGGAEVLAQADVVPALAVATESHPPNITAATARLHPRGIAVVAVPDEPPLPFADAAFDLVTSHHPATVWCTEIARVLTPRAPTWLSTSVRPARSS